MFSASFFVETCYTRGGFKGEWCCGRSLLPQRFDPLPTQRVPLWYFLRNPFLVTDPKIFLEAPSGPIYNNFEGKSALKKRDLFSVKIFQKVPKNGAENLTETAYF